MSVAARARAGAPPAPHPLSSRAGGAGDAGWVEAFSSLTEKDAATALVSGGSLSPAGAAAPGGGGGAAALAAEVARRGEALVALGADAALGPVDLDAAGLDAALARLRAALAPEAELTALERRTEPTPEAGAPARAVADVLARRAPGAGPPVEVRLAVVGNVDAGKSTLIGVLTRGELDDGRGLARSRVFRHAHEAAAGRTSSVTSHTPCLGATGGAVLNDAAFKAGTEGGYVARAAKVVTLIDLAGHERYLRSTAFGLTAHFPDHACLIVSAGAGLIGMAREHLGIVLALRIPVFFVVTKIDATPAHVLKVTLESLAALLRRPGVRRRPFRVRCRADALAAARGVGIHAVDALAPVFLSSCVTGEGLDLLRLFVDLLPLRRDWAAEALKPAVLVVDEAFSVPGVGAVVAGTLKAGVVRVGESLLLGPDPADGTFRPATVRSIQYKRCPVSAAFAGQTAALALRRAGRAAVRVRKGMALVAAAAAPAAAWEFEADVAVLTHSTTIGPRYQAVIHCEQIRQTAAVVSMSAERMRSGDRARVRFRFIQRPEFISIGSRLMFREGRAKGVGVVTAVGGEAAPAGAG